MRRKYHLVFHIVYLGETYCSIFTNADGIFLSPPSLALFVCTCCWSENKLLDCGCFGMGVEGLWGKPALTGNKLNPNSASLQLLQLLFSKLSPLHTVLQVLIVVCCKQEIIWQNMHKYWAEKWLLNVFPAVGTVNKAVTFPLDCT